MSKPVSSGYVAEDNAMSYLRWALFTDVQIRYYGGVLFSGLLYGAILSNTTH